MFLNEIFEDAETLLTQRNVLSIDVSPYELSTLMKNFRAQDPTYNKIGNAAMVTFYSPEERKEFEQFLRSEKVKYSSVGELSESRITVLEATRDELIANVQRRQREMFIDRILDLLHQSVQQDPDRQTVKGRAFDIARQVDLSKIGLDIKSLTDLYKQRYNITEAYKLQLERDSDADMMVLHIKDTRTGKRTEVRGKPGYESAGYDSGDRLHQLLDKIGKAANVSELINGEIVTINPKHPQYDRAQSAANTAFNESLDNPYPYTWAVDEEEEKIAVAEIDRGEKLEIYFEAFEEDHTWEITFKVDAALSATNRGDQFRIFATVAKVVKEWLQQMLSSKQPLRQINFRAFKDDEDDTSREKLYSRFAKRIASNIGFKFSKKDYGDEVAFYLDNPKYKQPSESAITEALDKPYAIDWNLKRDNEWFGWAKDGELSIQIKDGSGSGMYGIVFKLNDKLSSPGTGDQFRIFATVVTAVKEWWAWASKNVDVKSIWFSAEKVRGKDSRSKLYSRFAKQFAREIGYDLKVSTDLAADIYHLKKPDLEENFADGKVKGKSRPGRFKKAGVSCKGSVTSLRKKAKNASGEKQKGFHWCANMKAGKNK